jgi:hypothetical protein
MLQSPAVHPISDPRRLAASPVRQSIRYYLEGYARSASHRCCSIEDVEIGAGLEAVDGTLCGSIDLQAWPNGPMLQRVEHGMQLVLGTPQRPLGRRP